MRLEQIMDAETLSQYELYAAAVAKAIPEKQRMAAVIRHALRDWMELIGEGDIEAMLGVPYFTLSHVDENCGALEDGEAAPVTCDSSRMN